MKPRLLALTSVLFWATASSAFKITLRWISPYQLVTASSAVSTIVLWIVALTMGSSVISELSGGRSTLRCALRGLLNPFLYYLVLLEAYHRLPAQIAMVINYLWPVVLMILSVPLLKQRITAAMAAASLCGFCGVAVLALGGNPSGDSLSVPAMGLALLSTVIWALYWVLNVRWGGDSAGNLAGSFSFGLVYLVIYGIATGDIDGLLAIQVRGVIGSIYIGLFEMGLTYIVWLTALKLARSTSEVGNYIFLTPFLALIFIGTAVGERIGVTTVAGLLLVILGSGIANIRFHRRGKTEIQ